MTLVNCTIASNHVASGGQGGGLYSGGDAGKEPVVKSTIAGDNWGPTDAEGPDLAGHVRSADYNLIESPTGFTLLDMGSHDIVGQNPQLETLAQNGGETPTHALQASSPAIDAGSCEDVEGLPITRDQRGRIRPQSAACDIGAYEFPGVRLSLTKSVSKRLPEPGGRITYTVRVENQGDLTATGGAVSDTLPVSLTLAGPILLEPPTAGLIEEPPALVTGLTVLAGEAVTVTFPVTVSAELSTSTRITNTATVTSPQVPSAENGSCTIIVVRNFGPRVYVPTMVRARRWQALPDR